MSEQTEAWDQALSALFKLAPPTHGANTLRRIVQRMHEYGSVPQAVMEELTFLTLEGYEDHEVDVGGVCSELRQMIAKAMQDRRKHGGISIGWPEAAE